MTAEAPARRIVDYDSQDYDYRGFWQGRDYERWAEDRVLNRLMRDLGRVRWFADFGGGFGRNCEHSLAIADSTILVDYSVTNLSRAAEMQAAALAAGRLHLIRADLEHLPLADGAVDAAMVIRVLHHLTDVDAALTEMARTVGRQFLVDVPIKHHLLGRVRALRHGDWRELGTPEPRITGETDFPFRTYHLGTVRSLLEQAGWRTRLGASVNNLRRWDRMLPSKAVALLRPAAYGVEWTAQRVGRGWWGPSQFVVAVRRQLEAPQALSLSTSLAARLRCPRCRGELQQAADAMRCGACNRDYRRTPQGFWDFTLATADR